jgi:hypothetical protein
MMDADEAYFKQHGEPLFSSHMIDLSEETKEENIAITKKYLERAARTFPSQSLFLRRLYDEALQANTTKQQP